MMPMMSVVSFGNGPESQIKRRLHSAINVSIHNEAAPLIRLLSLGVTYTVSSISRDVNSQL